MRKFYIREVILIHFDIYHRIISPINLKNTPKSYQEKSTFKIKRLEEVTYDQIAQSFQREDLIIYTNPTDFKDFLFSQNLENSALLLMSSGNYGGLNFDEVKGLIN